MWRKTKPSFGPVIAVGLAIIALLAFCTRVRAEEAKVHDLSGVKVKIRKPQAVEHKPFLPRKEDRTKAEMVQDFSRADANATWEEFRAQVALHSGVRVGSEKDFLANKTIDIVDCESAFPEGVETGWTAGKGTGHFGTRYRKCEPGEKVFRKEGQPFALTSCANPVISKPPEPPPKKVVEEVEEPEEKCHTWILPHHAEDADYDIISGSYEGQNTGMGFYSTCEDED